MNSTEPSPDAREVADAILEAATSTDALDPLARAIDGLSNATGDAANTLADAIRMGFRNSFESPEERDKEGQRGANVTDGLFDIARALEQIAKAIEGRKP